MQKRFFYLAIILLTCTLASHAQLKELNDTSNVFIRSLMNQPVKKFSLKDLDNTTWESAGLKNKVVVMNFWFTSCKPCILEMPHLNKLVEENKNQNVIFLAPAPEQEPQIRKFLKKYSFDYRIIPSSLDFINEMGVENFPTHLVIDQQGIIRKVFIGYADDIKEKLQQQIDKLINL